MITVKNETNGLENKVNNRVDIVKKKERKKNGEKIQLSYSKAVQFL